ncbi:MAG: pyrroline-5-carboxylate reductase [Alphaproteobacteria bacterium]|nr:pyrroline-5-carboxylate reductase [Alphaproteobacteria bacterium]MCB9984426.1 pyrroline-5-carboxylate reductase [Micavibrio sp.]
MSMMSQSRLLLVGCGKMGGALLQGWRDNIPDLLISILDPDFPDAQFRMIDELKGQGSFGCIVLAVKPQIMEETVRGLTDFALPSTLVISIAAGKQISFFEDLLGSMSPVIRVMPNTPAAVGCGMSVLCANNKVTSGHKKLAQGLMETVGLCAWVDDESQMDAVTAVSGSGPAYVFHMIEALAQAGISAGLSPDLSMMLARQTVIGSGLLAAQNPDIDAATLRQNVTSPGGTTEAALRVLMSPDAGLTNLLTRTVLDAQKRSIDLAKN